MIELRHADESTPSAGVDLRPYQEEGIARLRACLRAGARRPVLVAPTGSGKTVVGSRIVASAGERGARTLFVAHRRELIRQTFAKLLRVGLAPESIGIVMAGVPGRAACLERPRDVIARLRAAGWTDPQIDAELWALLAARRPQAPIQVASIDTARGKSLGVFDLIIVDECHRALSASYRALIAAHPTAVVLGLTATPVRGDGKPLSEIFDQLVILATPAELRDLGYLVPVTMYTAPRESLPDLSEVSVSGGEYNAEEKDAAINTGAIIGNAVEHWLARARGERTVVFSSSVATSRAIVQRFGEAGVAAEHLDGETPTPQRDAILGRLERGETRVVSNCDVLSEGWDMPCVSVAVLLDATLSLGRYLQWVGRILRPAPGKTRALILDHCANVVEHGGGPYEDREWSLGVPTKRRRGATDEEPRIKVCPRCYGYAPASARTCPLDMPDGSPCGHAFLVTSVAADEQDGDLVEVPEATREEKRAAFDELCRARGERKPGWVIREFLKRFGVKPPKTWKVPLREDERDERNPEVVEAWRGMYREAFARGYKDDAACIRFRERFRHWPSKPLLAERDAWVKAEREQQRAAAEAEQVAAWARADARHAVLSPLEQALGASVALGRGRRPATAPRVATTEEWRV